MTYATGKRAAIIPLEGLDYPQAKRRAHAGYRIRRAVWETWLTISPAGNFHFLLSSKLSRQLGTDYSPTKIDEDACDWEAA